MNERPTLDAARGRISDAVPTAFHALVAAASPICLTLLSAAYRPSKGLTAPLAPDSAS